MSFKTIQKEQHEWASQNFENRRPYQPILGAAEEVGELAHSFLKMEQGIRGNKEEHLNLMKDSIGDCVIFLMDLCNQMGWDFEDLVNDTRSHVKQRNWKKDKVQGVVG